MTDKENRLADMVARQFAEMVATGGSGGGGGGGEGDVFLPDPSIYTYYKPDMTVPEFYRWDFMSDNATIVFPEGGDLPAVGDKICVIDVVCPNDTTIPDEPYAVWGTVNSVTSSMFGPMVRIKSDGSTIRVNGAHERSVSADNNIFGVTKVKVSGSTPTGTKNITANGTYDVTNYASAKVNVPRTFTTSDNGKVVVNRALVAQTTQTITENGTYDTTSKKTVTVNVPNPSTGTKEITANGTHDVTDYASASVAVPPYGEGSVEITANGTHNVSGKASAVVNVSNSYSQSDEGKVVSSGAFVAQTTQNISANGTYNTTEKNEVVVNVSNSYSQSDEGKVVSSGALVAQTSQNISANGTYNTTEKNEVVVNVPNSYSQSDEGKVVSSGALVAQTSKTVTANGTVDTTQNNEVVVNVPDYTKLARVFRAGQSSGSIDITDDDIPSVITGLTAYAFYRKSTLRSFVSTAQIKAVENFAFQAASGLITVELLQIGSIGGSTFNGCTALTKARFGNITSIGTSAFQGCTALQDLFIDCENVPTLASTNAFTNVPSTCNIWVPDDLVDSFKAANNWSSFASQIKPVSEYEGERDNHDIDIPEITEP